MKKYRVNVNGYAYEVEIEEVLGNESSPVSTMNPTIGANNRTSASSLYSEQSTKPTVGSSPNEGKQTSSEGESINAPMQGKIIQVSVGVGEEIVPGQVVAVLEAMKMENEIVASEGGIVRAVPVTPGQSVDAGDVLISLS